MEQLAAYSYLDSYYCSMGIFAESFRAMVSLLTQFQHGEDWIPLLLDPVAVQTCLLASRYIATLNRPPS